MVFAVTLSQFPTVLTNIESVSYNSDHPEKHPWSGKIYVTNSGKLMIILSQINLGVYFSANIIQALCQDLHEKLLQ